MTSEPILSVKNLVKHFPVHGGLLQRQVGSVRAVSDVSFDIYPGETVALVGESGCGKSTVGKTIMRFHEPTSGSVRFEGRDLAKMRSAELRKMRRDVQFVFQDPYSSLPSRMPVGEILLEPLEIHGVGNDRQRRERVLELLHLVGLGPEALGRYPHEFSGGQRQRIGIARALALEPRLLILDEPISALDVSIQAQVINLLARLQRELGVAYLFIAHDLAVVRHLAHRVAVMYLGRIVEYGDAETVFTHPSHPYSQALLSAVPQPDPRLAALSTRRLLHGELPSPTAPPSGCSFHTRCWKAKPECAQERPLLQIRTPSGAESACFFAEEEPMAAEDRA